MNINGLIESHKEQLYRFCLYLEKNTFYAEELFQETWVKAIENIQCYDESKLFYPWLSKIAVNLYRDRLRRIKRELRTIIWSSDQDEEKVDERTNIEGQIM